MRMNRHEVFPHRLRPRHPWRYACFRWHASACTFLFEHLEAGDSLEVFLEGFPSVSRELAIQVLEDARAALVLDAHPA